MLGVVSPAADAATPITRIWLTHNTSEPATLVVNWESKSPGPSRVDYGASASLGESSVSDEPATMHHVAIPFPASGLLHYRVKTGTEQSDIHTVKSYGGDTLRVAAAANWQFLPSLDAVLKDDPHLLLSCGDMVIDIVSPRNFGDTDNTDPYARVIERYPALFASVPFMPALGNHDRQIRYAIDGETPEPLYDIEATAFREFFPLPGDGRRYHFDIPAFAVRFAALDVSHIRDVGTPRQSCQALDRASEQFRWYRDLVRSRTQRFMITYYNESSHNLRNAEGGAWETLLRQNSVALSGFGSYAERAEVKGTPYFNTGLKAHDAFGDRQGGRFYQAVASYTLLTLTRENELMEVELKDINGNVLDRSAWPGRSKPGARRPTVP